MLTLAALLAPPGGASGDDAVAFTVHARLGAAPRPAAATPPAAVPRSPAREARAVPMVPAAVRYVNAAELDVRPQIMTHVMPEYPAQALSGTRGRVVLQVFIGTDGAVDAVQVVSAKPPGIFEESATRAFAGARFTPGRRRGDAVATQLLIEVTFGD